MLPAGINPRAEWLEADGLGGFASGSVDGVRRRRYHALLLTATTPPTGRFALVNGFEAWVETPAGTFALSSQAYAPDVVHPDGANRLEAFETEPWPRWRFRLEDGTVLEHEFFVPKGAALAVLSWRLTPAARTTGGERGTPGPGSASERDGGVGGERGSRVPGSAGATLRVRPLLSGRDYHALHRENGAFHFTPETCGARVSWRPYQDVPGVVALSNGSYEHEPLWYRNFLYDEERARGLDCIEDLAAPGVFSFDLTRGEAVLVLAAGDDGASAVPPDAAAHVDALRAAERRRRRRFPSRLHRAADAYLVRRGSGQTIVAGYPWFTDWGRDAFIAVRGLCVATGRLDDAREILLAWADLVSEGMLPNRLPDRGEAPEYNSVDASLWYVIAVYDFLAASAARVRKVAERDRRTLLGAVDAILAGYAAGTRYGIRLDTDGLLAAGVPGVQLTWMDAKVGDWVVTPRIGKPVEVQALWLNALSLAGTSSRQWAELYARACTTFRARFWNEVGGYLNDVVDPGHVAGATDATFRPNQILAVGGLPVSLLETHQARRLVAAVEARLLTPLGLRSLAPSEPGYAPRYEGGVRERDGAYHQGTVWPWLLGPFVEAWVRVRGGGAAVKREARVRYLDPLLQHLDAAGLGHLPEIACGDPPHLPRGCPFQAWSVGEALRLLEVVLAVDDEAVAAG